MLQKHSTDGWRSPIPKPKLCACASEIKRSALSSGSQFSSAPCFSVLAAAEAANCQTDRARPLPEISPRTKKSRHPPETRTRPTRKHILSSVTLRSVRSFRSRSSPHTSSEASQSISQQKKSGTVWPTEEVAHIQQFVLFWGRFASGRRRALLCFQIWIWFAPWVTPNINRLWSSLCANCPPCNIRSASRWIRPSNLRKSGNTSELYVAVLKFRVPDEEKQPCDSNRRVECRLRKYIK